MCRQLFLRMIVPAQVVEDDLKDLGYVFSWQKLDAQAFLLRQRRTRVWGTADLMNESDPCLFHDRMKKTIESMSGTEHLKYEEVFDVNMPKQRLTNKLQQQKLKKAIERCRMRDTDCSEAPDVFIDTATGHDRDVEFAEHVSTCVRPTHHVYSNYLERCLSVRELWNCQGLFATAFCNPQAVDDIMQNPNQAQDLAGQGV